jgi:hypothetical protein
MKAAADPSGGRKRCITAETVSPAGRRRGRLKAMTEVLRHRPLRHADPLQHRPEGALLNAATVLLTLLTVMILFFGVFAFRAS